ncbi:carbon-nitrogen hydrolase family protein [Vibrio sp. T11.5]|uniref:carbon-nitrogen hydrolase family protein n=1 Tax=Vibrio sp. T11.5 TaxID=2998836 RepID=UPI0022CD2E7A|nr:carbon-nitrogen hydrolase family protein [Vibrio sp. T11.5]MDA0119235.1 carbon-nitrogen hydrolase family protein [Vibrio sp. T11.5]
MKFALLQFSISARAQVNYEKIKRAICEAEQNGAQVLLTQECALSGYPPIEIKSISDINFEQQEAAFSQIVELVQEKKIYVFLGLVRRCGNKLANSVAIIQPTGRVDYYDKRALWGWDAEHFTVDSDFDGVVDIQGVTVGVRVCYEVRFPEYFRELYKQNVDVVVISSCDIQKEFDANRYSILKSHLLTRAIENVFTVISVNSASMEQTAPTCVVDQHGTTLVEAEHSADSMTYFDYQSLENGFGAKGIIQYADKLLGVN